MLSHLPKKEQNLLPENSVWANTAEESKEAPRADTEHLPREQLLPLSINPNILQRRVVGPNQSSNTDESPKSTTSNLRQYQVIQSSSKPSSIPCKFFPKGYCKKAPNANFYIKEVSMS